MHSRKSLFEELSRHAGVSPETRAHNAFSVATKFLKLLEETAPDDKALDLMVKAWFRAVKDNDFSKFQRIYRKYKDGTDGDGDV